MSTSSFDSTFAMGSSQYAIPAGQTNAVYLPNHTQANLIGTEIRYISGGTLCIIGQHGATLAGATLAAATPYYLYTDKPLEIHGPAPYYIAALGATCVVQVLSKYSQGASFA